MTTAELAKDFTDLLKQNDHEGAGEKYNADDIVSYEAMEGPMAVCNGKEAVKQKGDWWREQPRSTRRLRRRRPISTATSSPSVSRWTLRPRRPASV